jgi:hypothetical protein
LRAPIFIDMYSQMDRFCVMEHFFNQMQIFIVM